MTIELRGAGIQFSGGLVSTAHGMQARLPSLLALK